MHVGPSRNPKGIAAGGWAGEREETEKREEEEEGRKRRRREEGTG
jgi:hypothetical protein